MSEVPATYLDINLPPAPVSYMHAAVERYVAHGMQPGSFLLAVLSNNLMEACANADACNQMQIFEWASYLHNSLPSGCHGSPEKVEAWMRQGGLHGFCTNPQE